MYAQKGLKRSSESSVEGEIHKGGREPGMECGVWEVPNGNNLGDKVENFERELLTPQQCPGR